MKRRNTQETLCAGLLALGAIEIDLTRSRKRCFLLNGSKFYVAARAVREGRTVQASRPISEAHRARILAACAEADNADALMQRRSPFDALLDKVFS
jgi:hypothetical protein